MGVFPRNSETLNKPGRLRESYKTETSMEGEHLWRKFNTTTMASLNFEGTYQQQGFNPQPLPIFELDQLENSVLPYASEANEFSIDVGKPETVHIKTRLEEMIKKKHQKKGTVLPSTQIKKPDPPKPKVKDEDPETIKKRRERNKIAAMKCRKRKRERIAKLEKRANEIRAQIRLSEEEKRTLQKERQHLATILRNHCCTLNKHSYISLRNIATL